MLKFLLAAIFLLLSSSVFAIAEEPNHVIHQELRVLLQGIETAINTEKYSDLKPYFDEKLHITTVNQQVISSLEGLGVYFKEWFGAGGYLKKLNIQLIPDALTQLYGDANNPTWGLVYGKGIENYQLTDGRNLVIKTRWTATVAKEADGKWRILALHIGTNFYDNPIFAAVKESTKYYAIGSFVVGILLSILITLFWLRRRR